MYRVYNDKHKTRTGNYRILFVRLANKPYTTKQGKQIGQIQNCARTCTRTPYKQGQEKLEDHFVSTSDVSISMMNMFLYLLKKKHVLVQSKMYVHYYCVFCTDDMIKKIP